jgi:hypothetical protein
MVEGEIAESCFAPSAQFEAIIPGCLAEVMTNRQ